MTLWLCADTNMDVLPYRFLLAQGDSEWFLVHSGPVYATKGVWLLSRVHRASHSRQPQSVSPQRGGQQRPLIYRQETGALLRLHAHQEALLQVQAMRLHLDTHTHTRT